MLAWQLKVKNKLLSLDPFYLRLDHSIRITLVAILGTIVCLLWRKPQISWLPITAALIPDVAYLAASSLQKKLVLIFGLLVTLIAYFVIPLAQFQVGLIIIVFLGCFINLSLGYFNMAWYATGMYLSIFTILFAMHADTGTVALDVSFSCFMALLVAYSAYFYIPLGIQKLGIRDTVEKNFFALQELIQLIYQDEAAFLAIKLQQETDQYNAETLILVLRLTDSEQISLRTYYQSADILRRRIAHLNILKNKLSGLEDFFSALLLSQSIPLNHLPNEIRFEVEAFQKEYQTTLKNYHVYVNY